MATTSTYDHVSNNVVPVRRSARIRARGVESSEVGHVERTTSVDTPVRRAHNEGLIAVRVAPFGSHSGNV